jgi:uncharacterized protein YdeI (YjbR/CyaY-like superfamily)
MLKFRDVSEMPADPILLEYIREAAQLSESATRTAAEPRKSVGPVTTPAELAAALKSNREALAAFKALSPSHRREYAGYVAEAKREETRRRRAAATVEALQRYSSRLRRPSLSKPAAR